MPLCCYLYHCGAAPTCMHPVQGESRTDLTTLVGTSRLDNIRTVFGPAVAKELLPLSVKAGLEVSAALGPDDGMGFSMEV